MLKAIGTLQVDVKRKRITVEMPRDITDYYIWFLERKYWIRFQSPRFGSHINIVNQQYHKDNIDWNRLKKKYHGKNIDFLYDPNLIRGGSKKGFIMFYVKVYSNELENIKKDAGVYDGEGYRGLHLTVATAGKSGSKIVDYWPQSISLTKSQ